MNQRQHSPLYSSFIIPRSALAKHPVYPVHPVIYSRKTPAAEWLESAAGVALSGAIFGARSTTPRGKFRRPARSRNNSCHPETHRLHYKPRAATKQAERQDAPDTRKPFDKRLRVSYRSLQ
jgi:hypothetical protein